jgi:DNA-binding MarR family transcriptional regulator
MKRVIIETVPRSQIDQILYNAMAAIYQFDQEKVHLFGMYYQDSYLLYYLRRNSPVCMSDIATKLSVHISNASRAVDRLERRKLVSRSKNPLDKRNVLVTLEPAGEQLMKLSEDHSYERIRTGMNDFSATELAAIIKAAVNLNTILGVPALNGDAEPESTKKSPGSKRRRT